jgi:glutaminyl-tRNA synthetase
MRRRGYPPGAIREFCERIGVSKVESESDAALLEWCVREELNRTAARRMAVLDPVKVVIDNWDGGAREVELANNPLDESAGVRRIPFGREIWIDRADFMEVAEKKFFRMTVGGEVRLRGACIFKCTGCVKGPDGVVTEIHGTWDPGSWGGNAPDGRKVKGTIHWVDAASGVKAKFRLYDRLFTEKNPMKDGSEGFLAYLNRDSLKVVEGYVEPSLAQAGELERFQFERTGYFVSDGPLTFNRTVLLKDSYKPA